MNRNNLRFPFLFLSGGKQYVVQYKPVAGAVLMQAKIGGRITYPVGIIFRVMTSIKGKRALPEIAV